MTNNPVNNFDTSFAKAMRLLHSFEHDATDQLKSMLDECMALKKTPSNILSKQPPPPIVKPVINNTIKTTQEPKHVPVTTTITSTNITNSSNAASIIAPSDDMDCTSMSCVVCKRVEQNVGNEIVECQECHSLYHIECHRQGLINENVKDPRFVWYCSACTSRRKKAKVPGKTTAPLSSNGSISKDSTPQNAENSPFKSWSFIKK